MAMTSPGSARCSIPHWQLAALAISCVCLGWLTSWHRQAPPTRQKPKNNQQSAPIKPKWPTLFCMVVTSPETLEERAINAVNATWGQRCDKLLFVSSQPNESLPVVSCGCQEGYEYLWGKVKSGFRYVHKNFNQPPSTYDWFLKADDDTYVIVENLKEQLSRLDARKSFVLGRRISAYITEGYMAGGSGYVLSKAALATLVENGFERGLYKRCRRKSEKGIEDVEMGMCLHLLGVSFVDTRDPDENLETFIPHDPIESLTVEHNRSTFWLHIHSYYKSYDDGPSCCSSRPVTFHRLGASMMRTMDYLLYRFKLARP